jgi:hypothetical protein
MTDKQIEAWAEKETDKHFEKYWQNDDGTIMLSDDRTGEMIASYIIEMSTYNLGLINGAKSYRDNLITNYL